MTSQFFTYNKQKVIQALRYHFITRREIKVMMILVNVFALLSAGLFFFKKISPFAFLISSLLWFGLMITFWFLLPYMVYRKADTFKDRFQVLLSDATFRIENERGGRSWEWSAFSTWIESPHFFHLYFNARSFFIIPKEAFEGDGVHAARNILKDKIARK
ncbi:MAG TPA: YcxB family protein [Ferruginibacter sp.]|nr:hypothetical protein [Chitinophagaceae bacterium]HRI23616.1 YcxB family protein [Ferruginibacter sp.]